MVHSCGPSVEQLAELKLPLPCEGMQQQLATCRSLSAECTSTHVVMSDQCRCSQDNGETGNHEGAEVGSNDSGYHGNISTGRVRMRDLVNSPIWQYFMQPWAREELVTMCQY